MVIDYPIVTKIEEENCLVSCIRWLGDGCLIAIMKQRQIERREKKTVWWKENDTETQFDDEEKKEREREKKMREKKRSEKEQHQHIETLYQLLRKWYTSNLHASSKKREEEGEREKIYIYIHYLSQHLTVHCIKKQRERPLKKNIRQVILAIDNLFFYCNAWLIFNRTKQHI